MNEPDHSQTFLNVTLLEWLLEQSSESLNQCKEISPTQKVDGGNVGKNDVYLEIVETDVIINILLSSKITTPKHGKSG